MAHPTALGGNQNPWLDLVRSIAILLVLFRHGERALNGAKGAPDSVLQTIWTNGWVGVDLFFVLSGYLIARHLVRAGIGSEQFRLGRYLVMRALRIVPAYYAVLLLVASGAFPLFPVAPDALGYRVAYHLLFLQDYLPSDINVVFWSLGVEEKFYLLAPVLVLMLLRANAWRLCAIFFVLIFMLPLFLRGIPLIGIDGEMSYPEFWRTFRSPFHMALEGLLIGVAIAVAENAGMVRRSPKSGLFVLVAAMTALGAWLGTHDFMARIGWADVLIQPPLIALLAGGIVLGAVQLSGTAMPLTPPFKFVSRLSYSLFLIHFPLIPMGLAIAKLHGPSAFWAWYLIVSLSAALLLHLGVERPFLQLRDRLHQGVRIADRPAVELHKPAA
jgi:peptidoglycan/LPS O-acetylase OafA/YrhL